MVVAWISIVAFFASYALTAWLLRHSRIAKIIDRPNPRSSHSTPTPRGGGLSIVVVTTCGAAVLAALGIIPVSFLAVLVLGGVSVAAVGFWDDIHLAPVA